MLHPVIFSGLWLYGEPHVMVIHPTFILTQDIEIMNFFKGKIKQYINKKATKPDVQTKLLQRKIQYIICFTETLQHLSKPVYKIIWYAKVSQ